MPEVASKIESTSTELELSPSKFTQRRADYVDLLAQLATKLKSKLLRRVLCCAAELISYFSNWNKWKLSLYREGWFYQSLRKVYQDLTGAYSIHVIREAIAFLVELGILLVNENNRAVNNRNGQDKTHCYLIDFDRLKSLLTSLVPQSKKSQPANTETAETPSIKSKTRSVKIKTRRFTVETHTKIQSLNPSKNSFSLLEEREELNLVQEELEDPWTVEENKVEQKVLASFSNTQEITQEQKDSGENQFSAAPEPECSEVVQPDLKPLPKLKSDRPSGFRSDTERDGFYQELLELGRTQGKNSPVAWASAIVKSINAGEPCQYLTEYREGQQVGSSEKQEWEIAPGQPHDQFLTYLKIRTKKPEMTDEQAIMTAHQQLKNVHLARSLWESFKRCLANRREDWEQQKQLGVQNPYLPSELLPEREVSLEQAVGAIGSLQTGCAQLPAVEPAELEPVKKQPIDPELELANLAMLQQELNSAPLLQASLIRMKARKKGYCIEEGLVLPAEGMPSVEYLRSLLSNSIMAPKVKRLVDAHPEWGFWIDEFGELWGF
jgi:hypothetical protein